MDGVRLFGLVALIGAAFWLSGGAAMAGQPGPADFPFAIPYDGLVEGTAPADLAKLDAPAGAEGFVQVSGDRFVLSESGRRIRFWATNLCFGGCFPPHDVADRMARRLATLGINCVRFHHMDRWPYPRGIWDAEPGWSDFKHEGLHPEALDRLDYLVARLAENGIYTNLNLHVSREYDPADGFPEVGPGESVPRLGKAVDNYYPEAVREQKRYARMLLRHVNAYTGNAYAEEPAVAMVEINNENGLLRAWQAGWMDALPEAYRRELELQWNDWLMERYGSTMALREAWSKGETAGGGTDLLPDPAVQGSLQAIEEARATLEPTAGPQGRPAQVISVQQASDTGWHVQHSWRPLAVEKGRNYVLRISMRANRPDSVTVNCMMNHEPWRHLGLSQTVQVGVEWRDYELFFTGLADEAPDEGGGGARVTLTNLSKEGLRLSFTRPTLHEAALRGIPDGQTLEGTGVWLPARSDLGGRTEAVRRDLVLFLRDTEVGYWREMRRFLKEDLGARAPVTGTQVHFTSPYMMAEAADFIDSHAYWHHPHFPGRPWDPENWRVQRTAMVARPGSSTLARLAGARVFGMPYTVTEYNHPQPQPYAAEGLPLIAVYAALQGWDGVFEFQYANAEMWETDRVHGYFDMAGNPAKLAALPACSAILRHGIPGPLEPAEVARLSADDRLGLLRDSGPGAVNAYSGGVDRLAWQEARIGVAAAEGPPPEPSGSSGRVEWRTTGNERGLVRIEGDGVAGLIGFAAGETAGGGGIGIRPGETSLDGFCVVVLNAVDGQALGAPGRYLLTAIAGAENQEMGWNADRTSVGRQWGRGPILCEGVPVTLQVQHDGREVSLYPLNPDGTRRDAIGPGASTGEMAAFRLGPEHRTLWYELVVGK